MPKFVSEDFIRKCNNAATAMDLNTICESLYVYSGSGDGSLTYENCPVKDKEWDAFDACKQAEDRLGMGHFHSAFIATKLSIPRIKRVWNGVKGNTYINGFDDFLQDICLHFASKAIDKIDYSKGNSFNCLYDEIRTVAQTTGAPDHISKHMKDNHPELAVSTWTDIASRKGDSSDEMEFDIADPDFDTLNSALKNIEMQDNADYFNIISNGESLNGDSFSKKVIQNELIGEQLFGGIKGDHDLISRINENRCKEDRLLCLEH